MRKIGSVVTVAAALSFAAPAAAQVSLDLKTGYGVPFGDSLKASSLGFLDYGAMNSFWSGEIPIEVAGRWRFTKAFSAGVYFQYDPALIAKRVCAAGFSCSGSDVRVGVQAAFSLFPDRFLNPWGSIGSGWEWTTMKITIPDDSVSITMSGWEYFNVQAGLDFNLSPMFAVGPWIGFFGGSYSTVSGTWSGEQQGPTIPSSARTFHCWLQFGAKGTVNL
jgi:hypothetical protein